MWGLGGSTEQNTGGKHMDVVNWTPETRRAIDLSLIREERAFPTAENWPAGWALTEGNAINRERNRIALGARISHPVAPPQEAQKLFSNSRGAGAVLWAITPAPNRPRNFPFWRLPARLRGGDSPIAPSTPAIAYVVPRRRKAKAA